MIKADRLQRVAVSPDRGPGEEETKRLRRELSRARSMGATAFMYREKSLGDPDFLNRGEVLRELCRDLEMIFLLNERVAMAGCLDVDAVHATFRSAALSKLRREGAWPGPVGISVHSVDEARSRVEEGYDYLIFGPIHATPSKAAWFEPLGLSSLRKLTASLGSFPVVAIGGFDESRAREAEAAGAVGVAMMRGFFERPEPEDAVDD